MLSDKGTYMAPGGLKHAGEHALGTIIVLFLVFPWYFEAHLVAVVLGVIDGIIHYHVDWAKININKSKNYSVETPQFWMWLGADQMVHQLKAGLTCTDQVPHLTLTAEQVSSQAIPYQFKTV